MLKPLILVGVAMLSLAACATAPAPAPAPKSYLVPIGDGSKAWRTEADILAAMNRGMADIQKRAGAHLAQYCLQETGLSQFDVQEFEDRCALWVGNGIYEFGDIIVETQPRICDPRVVGVADCLNRLSAVSTLYLHERFPLEGRS